MTAAKKFVLVGAIAAALSFALTAKQIAFADEPPPEAPAETPAGDDGAEHAEHAHEGHEDPTKHFNFLGSPGEHYGKDVMGGKYGDGVMTDEHGNVMLDEHGKPVHEEEMSAPFIFMVLNFVLLLIVLAWKGKPAIEKLAADRHDQIKTALEEAARLREQAKKRLEEYGEKLQAADAEIKAMIEGMRADAEADKKRILEAAERQATQMKHDAESRIAAEIELARTALTREVTAAATQAAEQLLREKTTAADQQKIVTTFIAGVQNVGNAGTQRGDRS